MKKKQKAVKRAKLKCCFCGTIIHDPRFACNALPLANAQCCPKCDDLKVTPARLMMRGVPEEEAKTIGKNILAAVQFAQRRWLEAHDERSSPC